MSLLITLSAATALHLLSFGPASAFQVVPGLAPFGANKSPSSIRMQLEDSEVTSQTSSVSRRGALSSMGAFALATLGTQNVNVERALATTTSPAIAPGGKISFGRDDIMSPKEHGTTTKPVQEDLRYGVSRKLADRIVSYNRHFAEMGGYFENTSFRDEMLDAKGPVTFYDSVTGKPLFVAPIGRTAEEFIQESEVHGWPSFRDQEVVWENVKVLRSSGETVSDDGSHLGHNLPDRKGNRYCINLVSVAGNPSSS